MKYRYHLMLRGSWSKGRYEQLKLEINTIVREKGLLNESANPGIREDLAKPFRSYQRIRYDKWKVAVKGMVQCRARDDALFVLDIAEKRNWGEARAMATSLYFMVLNDRQSIGWWLKGDFDVLSW